MPFITMRGAGSAKGYGLTAAAAAPLSKVVVTSRNGGVSEGESSNFASASTGLTDGWGYSGNNTDAIVITTSGSTVKISGITINNLISGSNTFTGILYLIAGNTTGGAILGSSNFNVVLPANIGSTMIRFTTPVTIDPGVYTCALAWPNNLSGRTYRYDNTSNRTSSSVTVGGKTLNVSYSSVAAFNGAGPLGASNGTSAPGAGQCVSYEFLL